MIYATLLLILWLASNVMMVNGLPFEYLEPEESAIDQFGDAF